MSHGAQQGVIGSEGIATTLVVIGKKQHGCKKPKQWR